MANTEEAPQYAHLVDKEPTDLHKRFADWLVENTGLSEDEVDLKTVQLACSLRIPFQKSPENQASLESARAAAEDRIEERAAKAEERAAKREQAAIDKAAKQAAAKAKKEADAEAKAKKAAEAPEEAEAPAKPTRRRRGAAAPAPEPEAAPVATTRRRRGKPAPAPAPVVEEDFDEDDEL